MTAPNPRQFTSEKYLPIASNHLVVYSIYSLYKDGDEISAEDIISACFILFPKKFSLRTYLQWPDSALVGRRLHDCEKSGWITAKIDTGFKLTAKGTRLAEKIAQELGVTIHKKEKQKRVARQKVVEVKPEPVQHPLPTFQIQKTVDEVKVVEALKPTPKVEPKVTEEKKPVEQMPVILPKVEEVEKAKPVAEVKVVEAEKAKEKRAASPQVNKSVEKPKPKAKHKTQPKAVKTKQKSLDVAKVHIIEIPPTKPVGQTSAVQKSQVKVEKKPVKLVTEVMDQKPVHRPSSIVKLKKRVDEVKVTEAVKPTPKATPEVQPKVKVEKKPEAKLQVAKVVEKKPVKQAPVVQPKVEVEKKPVKLQVKKLQVSKVVKKNPVKQTHIVQPKVEVEKKPVKVQVKKLQVAKVVEKKPVKQTPVVQPKVEVEKKPVKVQVKKLQVAKVIEKKPVKQTPIVQPKVEVEEKPVKVQVAEVVEKKPVHRPSSIVKLKKRVDEVKVNEAAKPTLQPATLNLQPSISPEEKARAGKFVKMMETSDAYRLYKKNGAGSNIGEFDFRSLLLCTMESSPETLARNVELFKGYAGIHHRQDLTAFLIFCTDKFSHLLVPQKKVKSKK